MADGGIIESALLSDVLTGAAIGGGTALLTGQDPLKGAIFGGVTGGAFGGGATSAAGIEGGTGITATPMTAAGVSSGAQAEATAASLADIAQSAGTPIQGFAGTPSGVAAATPQIPTGGISDLLQQPVGDATGQMGFKVPDSFARPESIPSSEIAATSPTGVMSLPSGMSDMSYSDLTDTLGAGKSEAVKAAQAAAAPKSTLSEIKDWWKSRSPTEKILYGAGGSMALQSLMNRPQLPKEEKYKGPLSKFHYDPSYYTPSLPMAEGGIATLGGANIAVGGDPRRNPSPIDEDNANQNNWQAQSSPTMHMARGGIADLGSYSDGGRLLKGPGDGMSDNIPATIGRKQPARLAEGEFVVPADVVSHLGNGSTDAGAKKLYDMMNKVRKARTGTTQQGRQINPDKYMPGSGVKAMASGGGVFADNKNLNLGGSGVNLGGGAGAYTPQQFEQMYNAYNQNYSSAPRGTDPFGGVASLKQKAEARGVTPLELLKNPNAGLSPEQAQFNKMMQQSGPRVGGDPFGNLLYGRNLSDEQKAFNQQLQDYNKARMEYAKTQPLNIGNKQYNVPSSFGGFYGGQQRGINGPLNIWQGNTAMPSAPGQFGGSSQALFAKGGDVQSFADGEFYRTMDTPPPGYRVSSDAPAFYQPIYRASYEDYNVGNPLSISEYGTPYQSTVNPGIAALLAQFSDAAQARSAAQSGK
jgi:hypothetical protein